jgi:hypothetical protein
MTYLRNGDLVNKDIDYKRQGSRNKRKGRRKQLEALRQLQMPEPKLHHLRVHEEGWNEAFIRVEVKAGKQIQTLWNRYLKAKEQNDSNLPNDDRPFVFVAKPDGTSEGLVCFNIKDLDEFCVAYQLHVQGIKYKKPKNQEEE